MPPRKKTRRKRNPHSSGGNPNRGKMTTKTLLPFGAAAAGLGYGAGTETGAKVLSKLPVVGVPPLLLIGAGILLGVKPKRGIWRDVGLTSFAVGAYQFGFSQSPAGKAGAAATPGAATPGVAWIDDEGAQVAEVELGAHAANPGHYASGAIDEGAHIADVELDLPSE